MTDRKALVDQNETPEDVATLYSWANLHGAKYRDFSASRAQTREKARLRVEEAIAEERRRAHDEAEVQKAAEAQHAADSLRAEEAARNAEFAAQQASQAAQAAQAVQVAQAAQQAERAAQAAQAAQQRTAWQQQQLDRYAAPPAQSFAPAPAAPYVPAQNYSAPQRPAPAPQYPVAVQQYTSPAPQYSAPAPQYAAPAAQYPAPAPQSDFAAFAPPQAHRQAPAQPQFAPVHEENYLQQRNQWAAPDPRENNGRPAWLASDRPDVAPQPVPQAPEDTLQGSRDRLTSRWFALKGVFEGTNSPAEAAPQPAQLTSRAPVIAVFSLAGGVGKTSLVATLGRALSARGERVLLMDTAAYGVLPFFFGARDQRPGVLRTFSPPSASGDAPIQMVTVDPDTLGPENAAQETLSTEIARNSRGVNRVIVDLATASGATTRRVMRMAPTVLVPVVPDMSSMVSVSSIDAFFQHNSVAAGKPVLPYYVLNQFDPSLPLHLDVREVLREQVGDRLLPFALRRAPAVSEALAEGMTVMDYAPNSAVAEDFGSLAAWVKSLAAPAATGFRGVRWSER
jgi:cellulose synthase operon protein YhjQ